MNYETTKLRTRGTSGVGEGAMGRFIGIYRLLHAALICTIAVASLPMPNMNGNYYPLSNTPNSDVSKFPKSFAQYGRHIQSFDVYSPQISQLYSQVFWKGLPPVDLPPHIVSQFKHKGMAVVGFEMDQVRRVKQKDGTVLDVSVPINVVYNHHFESKMIGSAAKFKHLVFTGPQDPRLLKVKQQQGPHGMASEQSAWVVEELSPSSSTLPSSQSFGGANGGEYRLSYHGYAPGYVQVLESPTQFQITPMQIDTWNRDKMNLTGPTRFVPGPVPRSSLAPTEGPDALYSGLLECPLTTRIHKTVGTTYTLSNGHTGSTFCASLITTAKVCGNAATQVLGNGTHYSTVVQSNNTALPLGCSVTSDPHDASLAHVSFRASSSGAKAPACGGGPAETSVRATTQSLVNVSVTMVPDTKRVQVTLKGPSTVWFGVGFNASRMADNPWAIIVEGGATGNITERRLADQNPGQLLQPSITVVAVSIANGVKTVVIECPVTNTHYTFQPTTIVLPFINAIGTQPLLSYHKDHAPNQLVFSPVQTSGSNVVGNCICNGKPAPFGAGTGTLTYIANASQPNDVGTGTVSFANSCPPQPRSDLLEQKNPTCDVRTYRGGQTACHHMWSLLDSDMDIPWPKIPLNYHLKFRFWVQEYNASYHTQLARETWGIGE